VHRGRVLDRIQQVTMAAGAEPELGGRRVAVGQQAFPVAGVLPGPGDHPGAVDRRGRGEHLLQDPVEFCVGGQPGGDHALLEPAHPGRDGKLGVLAAHGASSR
jgi:hypothetical protein